MYIYVYIHIYMYVYMYVWHTHTYGLNADAFWVTSQVYVTWFVASVRRRNMKDESCLTQVSHISCIWLMSPIDAESCGSWLVSDAGIWKMSHVSHKWVLSYMNESCLLCSVTLFVASVWRRNLTLESWLMYMSQCSKQTFERWVMSHIYK